MDGIGEVGGETRHGRRAEEVRCHRSRRDAQERDDSIASQGYPTEIFEVTPEIAEHQERFAQLISHRVPFAEAERAFQLALTPGAAEKVVVTFDDHR
ncbi:hypothetical protein [Sphaerisporangium perillae]|uniref:hypothetical protein n=1 Tax=Sphaerisporangium perillae TaxID=2935860 RepID=UPI00200E3E17|nr:hypothetical protein [Sphaerisporangium perillae]